MRKPVFDQILRFIYFELVKHRKEILRCLLLYSIVGI